MNFENKHIIVTGGAGGIGGELCRLFAALGAKVVVSDLNASAAHELAESIGGLGFGCDVSDENSIKALIIEAEKQHGPVDMFVSNAGFAAGEPDHAASASNDTWQRNWDVHVMAHVYASRALLPAMLERGDGYLVNVASAAGLLSQVSDAAYTAAKHAAVAFAESLAISHADQGLKVSVICPQYVATNLIGVMAGNEVSATAPGVLRASECAKRIVDGLAAETFLILPHAEIADFTARRGADVDRWLSGMRRYRASLIDENGKVDLANVFKTSK